jgi:hypothetical protein
MASRGEQGLVAGSPLSGIPSGRAYFWGDNIPLQALQPDIVDLSQRGVHCIVIPPGSFPKRPLTTEFPQLPVKKRKGQCPLDS